MQIRPLQALIGNVNIQVYIHLSYQAIPSEISSDDYQRNRDEYLGGSHNITMSTDNSALSSRAGYLNNVATHRSKSWHTKYREHDCSLS